MTIGNVKLFPIVMAGLVPAIHVGTLLDAAQENSGRRFDQSGASTLAGRGPSTYGSQEQGWA
ncbi:MAG: hypothetical protein ACT4N4_13500 [Rhodospirillales bacterium]